MGEETFEQKAPDFESIKQVTSEGAEYWSARELLPLLGYKNWQNFEVAIKRAKISCEQVGQTLANHFTGAGKMVKLGSGSEREVKDFVLSRFACYLIAQNGDPRKSEIAHAQAYFAATTREHEVFKLYSEQQERLAKRERVEENNESLKRTAIKMGVLPQNWGRFEEAGYKGLYGGLDKEAIKTKKGVAQEEDILDRMGKLELAINDFRITQTEDKLLTEKLIGQSAAVQTHENIGLKVRKAIEDIGGKMPEELPAEPSIKPLLKQKQQEQKKQLKRAENREE